MIIKLLLLLLASLLQCVPTYCSLVHTIANQNVSTTELRVGERDYLQWVSHIGFKTDEHNRKFQQQKQKWKQEGTHLKACKTIKVRKNPKPSSKHYASVQEAINSLPISNLCRVVISIGPGTYREKVEVPVTMAYIKLKGAGAEKTIIEWDDTADRLGQSGQPLGTKNSATFAVNSPYFIAKNITFKNTAPSPASGAQGKQAVALRISADKAAFIGCKFIGEQDTLYDHIGRHYFRECYIEGSVDFVFGNGLSLYDNCHLHAVSNNYGALTAQKRESFLEETGFSFLNCTITGSGALYLGRAWGTFSRVVFAYTYMDKIIAPGGWYDWGDKNRDTTVFYGQYKCSGPGADHGVRVSWSRELTTQEAQPFISYDFIDGDEWLKNLI
ncbi:probable pectinesterase 53 [Beta vulgaris subsp. vulgaris]|uniref:probable pectinesterase 53 n=1 Tax=Beta vulgaris subsp. vulgaris TaxID=3555 RepID=UPI002036CE19|nr:probable pectinesterase 53 [Beta vulgaris subsp. vulgaris]